MQIFSQQFVEHLSAFDSEALILFNSIGVTFCALGIQSSMQYIATSHAIDHGGSRKLFLAQVNGLKSFMDSVGNTTFWFLLAILFNFFELLDWDGDRDTYFKVGSILISSVAVTKVLLAYIRYVLVSSFLEKESIDQYKN